MESVGICRVSLLGLDADLWMVRLTKEQISTCYAEWKSYKQYD